MIETIHHLLAFDESEVDAWIGANLFGPAEALIPLDHEQQIALLYNWAGKAGSEFRSYLAYFPVNFFQQLQYRDLAAFFEDLIERVADPGELENILDAKQHLEERSPGANVAER